MRCDSWDMTVHILAPSIATCEYGAERLCSSQRDLAKAMFVDFLASSAHAVDSPALGTAGDHWVVRATAVKEGTAVSASFVVDQDQRVG